MAKVTLKAQVRKVEGRKVKSLRAKGIVPANVYGRDVKSTSIEVNAKEFRETFKQVGETGIIYLSLGTEEKPVLVSNIQVHPATGEILHIDFKQVNLKEKVTANIPVELVGESPAEKSGIGTAVLLLQELEVEALPADLPEKFEIDATKLTEVDQVVKVSNLQVSGDVEIKADEETVLAKVEPPQKEEEIQPAEPVAAEGEEGVVEVTQETAEQPQEEKSEA